MKNQQIPFITIKSSKPGPTILLTACLHGDEIGGRLIIQETFKILKGHLLRGNLAAFPILNPVGFKNVSRYSSLEGQEDLNRLFPGKKEGTKAEKTVAEIFKMILEKKPDLVIDIHNDWKNSIPHILIDNQKEMAKSQAFAKAKELSQQTGLITVLDSKDIEGTLSFSLLKQDTPALAVEFGEPQIKTGKNIKVGVKAILNLLSTLKMIKPPEEFFIHPARNLLKGKFLKYADQSSSTQGTIRFCVKPGQMVKKGETVATIHDDSGALQEEIKASAQGVVLGQIDSPSVSPGTVVISFGLEKF